MFPEFTLTTKGEELLNKAIGERKVIKFTVFKLGKGDILANEDIREIKDVKNTFKTVPVLDSQVLSNQMLKLKGYFDNKGLTEDTLWKEIGVFAQIGEDSLTEIMYSYTNAKNEGILIPSETRSQSFRRTLDIRNYIGYATDVTFNITEIKDRYAFNTLREMQIATFLREGDKIELWGKENLGDESLKFYIVEEQNNNGILLENGLYANIYEDLEKKQNETDNRLLTTVKTIWGAINELFNNKLEKGGYIGTAKNLLDEISKKSSKTILGRMIVGKGMTADNTGKVSVISKNDGIIVNDNDIELNIVDNLTTNSSTRSLSAKQGKKLFDEKQNITDTTLPTTAKTIAGSIKELFTGKINTTDIVNNLTTTSTGKILDGRQGPAIVNKINGLAGGYNGAFPLTTAVKEGIYLLPATNKFYVCIENYNGSSLTAPNANFEELSVFQNRNKLENLFKKQWKHLKTFKMTQGCSFTLPADWEELIIFETEGDTFNASLACQIMQHKYVRALMNEYPYISSWQRSYGDSGDYEGILFNYNSSTNTFTQIKAVSGSGAFAWVSANCISIYYK